MSKIFVRYKKQGFTSNGAEFLNKHKRKFYATAFQTYCLEMGDF